MPTATAEQDVAEDWNVVIPRDRLLAGRAKGPRLYDRQIPAPSVDADVQEAAEQQAENTSEQRFDHPSTLLQTSTASPTMRRAVNRCSATSRPRRPTRPA